MARRLTTQDLINDVRSLMDETNVEALDDSRDILPALNRAQDYCAAILARLYEPPLLAYKTETLTDGEREFDIPEDAFEERVVKVEVQTGNIYVEVPPVSYRDATLLETSASVPYPYAWSAIGQKIRLYPASNGAYSLRLWYVKDPLPLVVEQGTITRINTDSNYVIVDSVGSSLSSSIDSPSSYVNVIDGQSGKLKGTYQIQSVAGNKVTFRTTPTRDTILNLPVSGTLSTDIELDDLICTADGTCVSILKKPVANYLVQYAAAELGSVKFGVESAVQNDIKKSLEEMVERSWAGRPQTLRVKLKNPAWNPYYMKRFR